ncbi:hypothetical protein M514_06965 [Trichuris suis]|uniref:Uncharacterized protein n=1 Tax=Trichuris suis TaxID=68888 RepID=A0A085MWN4_9BILA|nr:hypothetical protein M513_06965 [Trichuris suis]KFD61630.1 hypothetical protein M514_06965 [Trichuris suis]
MKRTDKLDYRSYLQLLLSKPREDDHYWTMNDVASSRRLPCFWLKALKNAPPLSKMVGLHEELALVYLVNIRTKTTLWPTILRIIFEFRENPFFENRVITKEYLIDFRRKHKDGHLRHKLRATSCKCCQILWYDGTVLASKRESKLKIMKLMGSRREKSFFEFLQFTSRGGLLRRRELQRNFKTALFIQSQFLPNVLDYYKHKSE